MKKATGLLFTAFISLYSIDSMAKTAKIDASEDVSECIKKFKNENIECLDDVLHNSEEQLNKAYLSKLTKIKKTSRMNGGWVMSSKKRKSSTHSLQIRKNGLNTEMAIAELLYGPIRTLTISVRHKQAAR